MSSICPYCGVDPTEVVDYEHEDGVVTTRAHGHECHCTWIEDVDYRAAWGICCARIDVGVQLMLEEDFHSSSSGAPWSLPSDCICPRAAPVPEGTLHVRHLEDV